MRKYFLIIFGFILYETSFSQSGSSNLNSIITSSEDYYSPTLIQAPSSTGNVSITNQAEVKIISGTSVELLPGFSADISKGCKFLIVNIGASQNSSYNLNQDRSYTYTEIAKVPVSTPAALDALFFADKYTTISYPDGIGRPYQDILLNFSPDHSDLIQVHKYDENGREFVNYLPYTLNSLGEFQSSPLPDQSSYYSGSTYGISSDLEPFTKVIFDNSPFNIPVEKSSPGSEWSINSGHTTKTQIGLNDNTIPLWEIQYDSDGNPIGAHSNSFYNANTLDKTFVTDEDGKTSVIYKDENGLIVSVTKSAYTDLNNNTYDFTNGQAVNSGGNLKTYITYNIYDEFGQLIYTVPAMAVLKFGTTLAFSDNLTFTDIIFQNYIYAYHYNEKGQITEKHVPGSGWTYLVYNKFNQLILKQDEKQRINSDWFFIKYDRLGRNVLTGIYHNQTNLGRQMQIFVSSDNSANNFEYRSNNNNYSVSIPVKYSNNSFPTTGISEIYSINYYDDYNFDHSLANFTQGAVNNNVNGMLTGVFTKIFDGSNKYLQSVSYYNDKEYLIEQHQQHQLNGWDIIKNTFNFEGKVIKTERLHNSNNNSINLHISNRIEYDEAGRESILYQKTGNIDQEIQLRSVNYNALGQVINKNLHKDSQAGSFLQNIDFRYNISGWLTSINNSALAYDVNTNPNYSDAFGEEIFYNNFSTSSYAGAGFYPINLYSGNISAITWKCRDPLTDPEKKPKHTYVYRYDDFDRMTAAYYASDLGGSNYFDKNLNAYNEKMEYDLAGNIIQINRNTFNGNAVVVLDDLNMNYGNNGFQLRSVTDNAAFTMKYDFHDGNSGSNDYSYDVNGNMINDANKHLSTSYNYFNLPVTVSDQTSNTVNYVYDAAGNKLSKTFNGITNYYIGGIEYENNNIKLISTQEGRVRPKSNGAINTSQYVYDYFLKDHIGNVRVILTEEQFYNEYSATMEVQNGTSEEQLFYNIGTTRQSLPAGYPYDPTYVPNAKASQLNVTSTTVGPAKILHVCEGDEINIDTKYFYSQLPPSSGTPAIGAILSQLANLFFLNPSNGTSIAGNDVPTRQQWANDFFTGNTDVGTFLLGSIGIGSSSDPLKPQAFLVHLFYDENFNFVGDASGVQQVQYPNTLGDLAFLNFKVPVNGFLYIYVCNESGLNAYFDNVQIHHTTGNILEEDHYYPYGMFIEPLTTEYIRNPINNYKYQDKEFQKDLSMNLFDFGARQYDGSLGRWIVQGPIHQLANPYIGMGNNPVNSIDPDGMKYIAAKSPPDLSGGETKGLIDYNDSQFESIS